MTGLGERGLDRDGVAQLLGVSRMTAWWWIKSGQLLPAARDEAGQPRWAPAEIYRWAVRRWPERFSGVVPVWAWPQADEAPAGQRPEFIGTVDTPNTVALCWSTAYGKVRLVWPLAEAHRPPDQELARQLAPDGDGALIIVTTGFAMGPELRAVLPGAPQRPTYGPRWEQLVRVLGEPLPYWPAALRLRQLLRNWRPGTESVTALAEPALDTATLLRTASLFNEGDATSRTLVNLARIAHQQAADSAQQDLDILADTRGVTIGPELVTVAARPLPVPQVTTADVDTTQRRAGWLALLSRTDTLAAACVRAAVTWNGGKDLPYSNPDQIEPTGSQWAQEWSARLALAARTAAYQLLDPDGEGEPLVDPETDAPVVRDPDGTLHLAVPQRIPAAAPLAELILDGPIWIRTTDGTLYPAPRDAYWGISWGYTGTGPGTLALLVARLLDDINAQAPAGANGAPELEKLLQRELPAGTVLTRQQLEDARRGEPG